MRETYTYDKSREAFARAMKVIPSGIYGHQGPAEGCYVPVEAFPLYSQKALGTYLWDLDGNRFIDYMCAYGPNILGYHDPDVDAAAAKQRAISDCTTLPNTKMIDFADISVIVPAEPTINTMIQAKRSTTTATRSYTARYLTRPPYLSIGASSRPSPTVCALPPSIGIPRSIGTTAPIHTTSLTGVAPQPTNWWSSASRRVSARTVTCWCGAIESGTTPSGCLKR